MEPKGFQLRPYQREAVGRSIVDLSIHDRVALILPTGAGKTEVFINICQQWLEQNRDKSILILSHLNLLTDQTRMRFHKRAPNIKTGVLQSNTRPHPLTDVVIGTMQTARIESRSNFLEHKLKKQIGLIIIDEAHFIQVDSYKTAISYFPGAKVLGVTATPFRNNQLMTNYFQKVSFSMSLQELIEAGYLVPPKLIEMKRDSDEISDVIAQVVTVYKSQELNNRAIVFMKTKDDARLLREVFNTQGIRTEAVTADTSEDLRDEYFEKFNQGEIKVLTSVNVLTAGFDCPAISAVFMPYAVGSVTQYLQRIGRGLRPFAAGGKEDCRIYCFGRTPEIKNRLFQKLQNLALNQGGKLKKYDRLTDQLEFNDWSNANQEVYRWNMDCVKAIHKMKKLGMTVLSEMLDKKEFPRYMLADIKNILHALPDKPSSIPHKEKPATEKQIALLRNKGLAISSISKGEASIMIGALLGKKIDKQFVVDKGRFKGKHVSELPFKYRQHVLDTYPDSAVAQKIKEYYRRRA